MEKIDGLPKNRTAWNKNKHWARLPKRMIGIGKKGLLAWIKNTDLQKIVKRDYATAQICEEEGLFKPAIILYAGVLEALLMHGLNCHKELKFSNLIDLAFERKLIRQEQASHMHTIRDFRNYVHVYKEMTADIEIINQGIADLCRQLCDSLIKSLKNKT